MVSASESRPESEYYSLVARQANHPGQVITVTENPLCPPINATNTTTSTTGPNGSLFFLSCGISLSRRTRGKWDPPNITISDLVINVDFSSVEATKGTLFEPCAPYLDAFHNASAAIGVPPILFAAFAMQESGCNPDATGSGGTAGLLQLSTDKCKDVNCYDPFTNIQIGAAYLQTLLSASPNIVLAVGSWNGWFAGMTYADATAVRYTDCYSQRNLDYLHQYFNGWLQGINAYGQSGIGDRLGYYFNLDVCDHGGFPTWGVSGTAPKLQFIFGFKRLFLFGLFLARVIDLA
ncbi:hypothetical protein FS842_008832 [Serendipita sp. 407]|nr:hypothetical protein FS842_008832 [Serendipita sp. 407]